MKRFLFILPLFLFLQIQPVSGQSPLPETFDTWIEQGMEDWEIPGMAVAIVKDDEVIYARGFGVRKLDEPEPVNEHTLFGIASVSKNITAASLALLVDSGYISWDDRVKDLLPWFELKDPLVTDEVRIRDLLTHRVGVGRILGNRLQFMTDRSREELIYQMRFHEFEDPFRHGFVYSNVMYTVAGEIVAAVSGLSWDQFVTDRLFRPAGMDRANTSILDLAEEGNAAWPHQYIEGEIVPIARRNWDNAAPAGGVNASAHEVAQWLRLQLGEPGVYENNRIISSTQMQEMHRPQIAQRIQNPYGSQVSYGLGWQIYDYEGYRVLTHGGATDGMNTTVAMIPELNLGIVVVSNLFNSFMDAVVYTVFDAWIENTPRDWNALYLQSYHSRYENAMARRQAIEQSRKADTDPTLDLRFYTGIYMDELYGKSEVRMSDGKLVLRLWDSETVVADLEHWHHDTFRAVWRNRAQREEFLHFSLGRNGYIESVTLQVALRPLLLQAGAYPTDYFRNVTFQKVGG